MSDLSKPIYTEDDYQEYFYAYTGTLSIMKTNQPPYVLLGLSPEEKAPYSDREIKAYCDFAYRKAKARSEQLREKIIASPFVISCTGRISLKTEFKPFPRPQYSKGYDEVESITHLEEMIQNYNTDSDCDDWIKERNFLRDRHFYFYGEQS